MLPPRQNSSGLLGLSKGYWHRLVGWAIGRVSSYGVVFGLVAAGLVLFAISLGVATGAGFHFLELRYGIWSAYAIVGGAFLGLALLFVPAALTIFKRKAPPVPTPPGFGVLLRRAIPIDRSTRLFEKGDDHWPVDSRSGLLAAGAAALLVAWVVVSNRGRTG